MPPWWKPDVHDAHLIIASCIYGEGFESGAHLSRAVQEGQLCSVPQPQMTHRPSFSCNRARYFVPRRLACCHICVKTYFVRKRPFFWPACLSGARVWLAFLGQRGAEKRAGPGGCRCTGPLSLVPSAPLCSLCVATSLSCGFRTCVRRIVRFVRGGSSLLYHLECAHRRWSVHSSALAVNKLYFFLGVFRPLCGTMCNPCLHPPSCLTGKAVSPTREPRFPF